jgi:dipeptidyl aminopeptidase/acylaminoacyl peptidase
MDEQLAQGGMPPPAGRDHQGANSPESLLLGAPICTIPDLVQAANPETYIRPGAPPFFLQHGTKDDTVPFQQSVGFASKLEKALGRNSVELELLEGAGHGDPQFEAPRNVRKVLAFLDRHVSKSRGPDQGKEGGGGG